MKQTVITLDLEGVLVPEIWIAVAKKTGIEALHRTTRDEPDYDVLMRQRLAILDETDSGLDIDALKIVAKGVNSLHSPDKSTVVVTHYQRLLDYIVPDFVHVRMGGRIVKSGDKDLAHELEQRGYDWIARETATSVADAVGV